MSTAPATSHTSSFDIKSAQWPVVALHLRTVDLTTLARDWELRFSGQAEFFDQDPLLIDLSALPQADVPDFVALMALLRSKRVRPMAYRAGTVAQSAAAEYAGLARADEAMCIERSVPSSPTTQAVAKPEPVMLRDCVGALVVDKPLRSGQQVYARGSDLIITAMVNPGAEVVADGNIHVYAPLRGKAIAGAHGDMGARIFARSLEAELVSVAGIYRTSERPYPDAVRGKAVQIRLDSNAQGDHLLIEPIA